MRAVLAVDLGSSNLRAALVDERGRLSHLQSIPAPTPTADASGRSEIRADTWWEGFNTCVTALATNRVVHTLEVADQGTLWDDLTQVDRLIGTGAPITPEERLEPGSLVEITSGLLAGLKGRILRAANGRRFVVQVNFIQRGASVLIDDFNLTAIDEVLADPVKN